jgi:hypothetical protein
MDFAVDSIEQIKSELKARWSFLHLVAALVPNLLSKFEVSAFYRETGAWIDQAAESEIRFKAQTVIEKLDGLIQLTSKQLPLKQHWTVIATEHWERCGTGEFSFNNGVQYGWIAERFNCAPLHIPDDMPYHARIGVGHHAGNAAVEEDFLLRDAFFMLAQCRAALVSLEATRPELRAKRELSKADYKQVSTLNQNVATYGRYAVFGFYSFVECFLNSVAEDFIRRNRSLLSPQQCEILRGMKNGRHISTERKIEMFPTIIRKDGARPIIMSDRNQIAEPFKSFASVVKAIRDSTTHFATHKAAIVVSPQDWEQRATAAAKTCLSVAREFWIACYPGRNLPLYLGELDERRHMKIAQERVAPCQATGGQ